MKPLIKAEFAVIALTLLSLVFTAGFFLGRNTSSNIVTIEKLKAADTDSSPIISDDSGTGISGFIEEDAITSEYSEDEVSTAVNESKPDESPKQPDTVEAAIVTETAALININTASAPELESLPGIGEVLAGRIITYRENNGDFKSIEEIVAVSGIGEKKYNDIKEMITVG